MKITITLSGIIGLAFVLISLAIVFGRINQTDKINQEKIGIENFSDGNIMSDGNMMNNSNMMSDNNIDIYPGLESSQKVLDSECAFDYIRKSMSDIRQKEAEVDFLEKKFKIPRFDDYHKLYQETKDKINKNNNSLLNQFIVDQYLQDVRVDKLKSDLSSLNQLVNTDSEVDNCPNPLNQSENAIKSIKSIKYGVSLNTHQVPNPDNKTDKKLVEPKKEDLPPGCPSYPVEEAIKPLEDPLMIYINQGCLSYSASGKEVSDDVRARDNYWVELCQKRKPDQLFEINRIKNKDDYNKIIKNKKMHQTQDDSDKIYPFNVIQPKGNNKQCLTLNKNGLSVENCLPLKKDDQNWNPSQEKRPC